MIAPRNMEALSDWEHLCLLGKARASQEKDIGNRQIDRDDQAGSEASFVENTKGLYRVYVYDTYV